MSEERGPPPGGYGLQEKPIEPPKPTMAPYRHLPMLDAPQQPRPKRWIGIPIVGIVVIALRLMLLCSKMSEPSPSYSVPNFMPLTIPTVTYAPPIATPPVSLGPVASDDRGKTYFVKRGELWVQPKDGAATWLYAAQGITGLATFKNEPYVLQNGDLHHVYESGAGNSVVTGNFTALAIDGAYAYLLSASSIQRVQLPNGAPSTIASTDPTTEEDLAGPMIVAHGFVWFSRGNGLARISAKAGHQIIGKPFASDVEPLGMDATKDAIVVATDGGVIELAVAGGKQKVLTPDGWDTACHEVVASGTWLYVAYQDTAGWAVGRMPRTGGSVDPLVHTVVQPHLARNGGAVVYSTPDGIRSVPSPD